ncbi:MAG: class I SAM-dependent methyltransferase [Clostridia bacterium]|nr:class I SAM-dependent methyltransferase [Clostridia bacterium]
MYIADKWTEYQLIDTQNGKRLESWAGHILERPDPQVIWKNTGTSRLWGHADAIYKRSKSGGGSWTQFKKLPEEWELAYESLGLRFVVKPMGFKHTGVFPEQAANWEWFSQLIREAGRPIKVLNLFAYTGGATIAAAKAGASVCHVDASQGMNKQAQRNAKLSGLADAPIRYIADDCEKFVQREIRRGNRYDAIIMDPPSYGRGPSGELWKLEDSIYDFVSLTAQLLSDKPLFFLINSYTTGLSPSTMGCILSLAVQKKHGGTVACDEVGLPIKENGTALPCGAAARLVF